MTLCVAVDSKGNVLTGTRAAEEEPAPKEEHPAGGGTGGGTTTGAGSSTGSKPAATITGAQITALLVQQLAPSGMAAKIGALLKNGGLTMLFKALTAGRLIVGWYEVPPGAKLAKRTKAKPVLVASGQMTFSGAGTGKIKVKLTAPGRRLLEHAKRVKLIAKGTFTPRGGAAVSAKSGIIVAQR